MPSHRPTRAVTAGLRSQEVKSRLVGDARQGRGLHGRASTTAHQRSSRTGARSTVPSPAADATAWIASAPTRVHGNSPLRPCGVSRRDVPGDDPGAPGCDVDDDAAVGREQLARALQQGDRVAADPDVAVGQEDGAPPTLARQRVEDAALQGRDAAAAASAGPPRARRRCRAPCGRQRARASVIRPGPQPTSTVGPAHSARAGRGRPRRRHRARRASAAAAARRSPSHTVHGLALQRDACRRWPAESWSCGHRRARRGGSVRRSSEPATCCRLLERCRRRSARARPDGLAGRAPAPRGCGRRCRSATSVRRPGPPPRPGR